MNNTEQDPKKEITRSPDFKYIPCDSINLAISDNGIKLLLGVEELDGSIHEMIGVHMTHRTAMFLKSALVRGLDHYQEKTGITLEEPEI